MPEVRTCRRCKEEKSLDHFRVVRGFHLRYCRDCQNDKQRIRDRRRRSRKPRHFQRPTYARDPLAFDREHTDA